jgi:ribosomal protein S18
MPEESIKTTKPPLKPRRQPSEQSNNQDSPQQSSDRQARSAPSSGGFVKKSTSTYSRISQEEFSITPLPTTDDEPVVLSAQAQDFLLKGGKVQVQTDVSYLNDINVVADEEINYKNIPLLKKYTSQFHSINSFNVMGVKIDKKKRRLLSKAVKIARFLGLLAYPDQYCKN